MQRYGVNRFVWKNGTYRLARCKVATTLQFVKKNTASSKPSKAKSNKRRCPFRLSRKHPSGYLITVFQSL